MRHFKTAQELRITPLTHKYLKYALRTLTRLNTPKKLNGGTFGFNMIHVLDTYNPRDFTGHPCGTSGCILGIMRYKARHDHVPDDEIKAFQDDKIHRLFFPMSLDLNKVTNVMAAKATRHYLETGKIKFDLRDK